jgi:BioD-like phosphotransacetylase family protein
VRPLYVVGTHRNVGKTTLCIGLINALRLRGLVVGYTKPLGQRVTLVSGQPVHDDALVVSQAMHLDKEESGHMALALTRGRVEHEIFDLHVPELMEKVVGVCQRLRASHDVLVVEGMGHVAMGSVLKLSAADVARIIGAKTILMSGGGIGRAIDDICLCGTFLNARGADMLGAIVNKVWPEKFDRVKAATTKGLDNLGIRSYGTVPYEEMLASPTVGQVAEQIGGRILCGTTALSNRVRRTIVAAMETSHMVSHLKDGTLVITPGDRNDNILAILSTYTLVKTDPPPVSGIILTGGFLPLGNVMDLLVESGLPTIHCSDDTYSLSAKLRETVFKLTPDDKERIQIAMGLVNKYVDVDGILEGLKE